MFALSRSPALPPCPDTTRHVSLRILYLDPHPRRNTTTSNPFSSATTRRDESRNSQLATRNSQLAARKCVSSFFRVYVDSYYRRRFPKPVLLITRASVYLAQISYYQSQSRYANVPLFPRSVSLTSLLLFFSFFVSSLRFHRNERVERIERIAKIAST